ncbi:GIY-YIG nuclease family protein [Pedobacter helvus]|uniref:GIY-YIG nuclease family protein n=1 Tax=Pedobacter helvus TaxID=2563444 RepID=A0ABW9JDK7_9SPHI
MANHQRSTLYIGVSSDLRSRIYQHKNKVYPNSFTSRYNLTFLFIMRYFQLSRKL